MSDIDPAGTYPVYAHPLVSWGSVILGALAAIAVGVLLNLLVATFDAAATVSSLNAGGDAGPNVLLMGVFGALANLFALFIGGFVAARAANHPDHHDGMLHGFGVWALAFAVALMVITSGVHGVGAAGSGGSSGMGAELGALGGLGAGQGAGASQFQSQSQSQSQALAGTGAGAPQAAVNPDLGRRAEADAAAEGRAEALDLAKAAEGTAFFGFTAMLVGLIAALVGGILGSRHPDHFSVRPRRAVFVR